MDSKEEYGLRRCRKVMLSSNTNGVDGVDGVDGTLNLD